MKVSRYPMANDEIWDWKEREDSQGDLVTEVGESVGKEWVAFHSFVLSYDL